MRLSWLTRAAALAHRHLWRTRAVTLGVRAIVLDDAGRVFLVRHTYTPRWCLPGGGVDRGETAEAAVLRELREEGGIVATARPVLHGLYLNQRLKRDHVACYVVRAFEREPGARADLGADWEIAETGFFAPDALPEDTTAATRARLNELSRGAPLARTW